MISLVRKSAKYLIIETNDLNTMENYLLKTLDAYKSDIKTAYEKTNENYTIIYLTDDLTKPCIINEKSFLYVLPQDVDQILCKIINDKKSHLVKTLKSTPRLLLFRHFGNIDKIMYAILKDYEGEVKKFKETFFNLDLTSNIIAFTEKPLIKNITIDDLHEDCIVINRQTSEFYRSLQVNSLRYLNEGLENKNWSEVDIRIYDIYSAYHLHYRRLIHVLENLELGLILGESWSKDQAVILLNVCVYSVKFFTFYDPKFIKQILLGLEFSSQNTRLCDYDLYFGKRKLSWLDFAENRKDTHEKVSMRCREELLKMLSPASIEYIDSLEKEIAKTKK